MSGMPCKCSGYRVDKCMCKVLSTGYHCDDTGSVVLLTRSKSLSRLLDLKTKPKSNIFMRLFENIYEICAGYNLRYCPMRGFLKHNNYFGNTLKDLIILTCFLIANFIVFVTILTKMLVHLYFVVMMTAQWIKRYFVTKFNTNEEVMMICPTQFIHDYNPPITRKYI